MEICINISASTPAEYRDALNALNAGILAEATSNKVKQLEKISLCYSAADTGAAQRKALIDMEVEG